MSRHLPIIVYFNGTFVHLENGAHVRTAELLRFLASLEVQIVVYSYRNHPTCPWGKVEVDIFTREFPGIVLVLEEAAFALRVLNRVKYFLSMFSPALFRRLARRNIRKLTPAWFALQCQFPKFVLLASYARACCELNGVPLEDVIIETHDIGFLNAMKQQQRVLLDGKTWLQARGELAQLSLASDVIAIAPLENGFFRLLLPDHRVHYIPTYSVYRGVLAQQENTPSKARYDLLFVGSENVLNVRGIVAFMLEHEVWLKTKSLAIVGRVCDAPDVKDAAERVRATLLGFAADLESLYNETRVVVSPVDGTGLKIKVIEALGAGKPVFGSRHTLEGLPPGYQNSVFPINEHAIDILLNDQEALVRAECCARRYHAEVQTAGDLTALRQRLVKSDITTYQT